MGIERQPKDGAEVVKFPKSPRFSGPEIDDKNVHAASYERTTDRAIDHGRPVEVEKGTFTATQIAEGVVHAFGNDPKVTSGVEYRIPDDAEHLEAMLLDFVLLPSNYSKRYQYLVAKAYLETKSR